MTSSRPTLEMHDVLKEHGLRSTGQRLAILRLLSDAACGPHDNDHGHRPDGHRPDGHGHGHLTVSEIHTRLAAAGTQLDVTTVYRTLTVLVELGVVHAVAHGSNSTYGLATDAHHHAVCTRCGTVTGIAADALGDALAALEQATGYRARDAAITVHSVCTNCRG